MTTRPPIPIPVGREAAARRARRLPLSWARSAAGARRPGVPEVAGSSPAASILLAVAVLAAVLLAGCQAPAPVREGAAVLREAFDGHLADGRVVAGAYKRDLGLAWEKELEVIMREQLLLAQDVAGKLDRAKVLVLLAQQAAARRRHAALRAEYDRLVRRAEENAPIVYRLLEAVGNYLNSGLSEKDRDELRRRLGDVGRDLVNREKLRRLEEEARRKAEADAKAKEEGP